MPALTVAALNVVASVSIILVNKQIVSARGFHFILTLLSLNFVTTGTYLQIRAQCGYLQVRHLPPRDRWLIAVLAVSTVLLNNASNEANSVGFYQITKLLIIPTVIFLERLGGQRKPYSRRVLCSLAVASLGVGVATVSDFEVNARGSVLALLSVLFTAQYQIWQGSKQLEHGLSASQITHSVSYPQALIGLLGASVLDVFAPSLKGWLLLRPGGLLEHELRHADALWVAACCLIAVVMNISTYGLIGKTSPVTYQVIGQLKTCLIVGLGYAFFDAEAPAFWLAVRFGGVGIAVLGVTAYAAAKAGESGQHGGGGERKES